MKNKVIWVIIIGIFILAININLPINKPYPEMVRAKEMGQIFQGNVTENFIGEKVSVDVVNDLVGFALLFIASIMLLRKSNKFFGAVLLIPLAAFINIYMPAMPFRMNGFDLYVRIAGIRLLYTLLVIGIEYFVIHGILKMTDCIQNRWHHNEMMIGWIIAMISKVFLYFLKFYGMNILFNIYTVIVIGCTVFYVNRLFKVLEFDPHKGEEIDETAGI